MEENNSFLYSKIVWYVLIATVTALLINLYSLAKYSSNTNAEMSLQIAKPIIEIEAVDIQLNNLDSEVQRINFKVKNYDENNEISDVAFNYQIKFSSQNGTPVIVDKLAKIENGAETEVEINNNVSSNLFIGHSEAKIDNYVADLKVVDSNFAGSSDTLKILVDAKQAIQ